MEGKKNFFDGLWDFTADNKRQKEVINCWGASMPSQS